MHQSASLEMYISYISQDIADDIEFISISSSVEDMRSLLIMRPFFI